MQRKIAFHRARTAVFLLLVLPLAASAAIVAKSHRATPFGAQPLRVFGGRGAGPAMPSAGKLDAALADLSRHLARVRAAHALQDLQALNPAAHFALGSHGPLVSIDAVTRGDPQQLKSALLALGLERPAVYANDVGGWLPVSQISAAAGRGEVLAIRAALSRSHAALATQGDFAQGSFALRTTFASLDGTGVTVGVLSDSFNCYAVYEQANSGVPASLYAPYGFADQDAGKDEEPSNDYLPASVNVLEEGPCGNYGAPLELPLSDEGRAMLQVVHAVAPGASLSFYTADNSEAAFATGIGALATAGARVIADDTLYFDEPFFQDGILAQAVDTVAAKGVVYFSAAGNNAAQSYETTTPSFTGSTSTGPNAGEALLTFDAAGASALPVTLPDLYPGEFLGLVLQWDQPYVTGASGSPGASSEIDLCVTGASGATTIINLDGEPMTCTGLNPQGADPVQVLIIGDPADAASYVASQTINVMIGMKAGGTAPKRVKLVVLDDGAGSVIDPQYDTHSPTLQGHAGAAGAAAVAAAFFAQTPLCGTSPAVLESYSSLGGDPILFDTSGTRLATPLVRQKPDFTAPDGINTSFFGFPLSDSGRVDQSGVAQCANNATYNNFFGTSAATPHAAGIGALALQSIPTLTPSLIIGALRASAAPMSGNTPNFESGYGFLQAARLSAPVVWFPGSAVSVGNATTLNWVALQSTSCTASGGWSGTQSAAGTMTVTPSATGSTTYTLTCTQAAGSQSSSATLQAVTALAITTSSLPAGEVASAYTATLSATGGVPPYTWSLTGGTLPAGLSLDASTGVISGTPGATASATALTVKVTDAENPLYSKSASLSLTVSASSSGSGGGALGTLPLLLLAPLVLARLPRRRVPRH